MVIGDSNWTGQKLWKIFDMVRDTVHITFIKIESWSLVSRDQQFTRFPCVPWALTSSCYLSNLRVFIKEVLRGGNIINKSFPYCETGSQCLFSLSWSITFIRGWYYFSLLSAHGRWWMRQIDVCNTLSHFSPINDQLYFSLTFWFKKLL